ncbi:hypothetical protein G9A89_021343 [Geosiphon pyriformis]|nr:hypothetical protein G9A89_021343 [Geosiphon pyriformis]
MSNPNRSSNRSKRKHDEDGFSDSTPNHNFSRPQNRHHSKNNQFSHPSPSVYSTSSTVEFEARPGYNRGAREIPSQSHSNLPPRKALKNHAASTPHDNTAVVAQHYNSKPDVGIALRNLSSIVFLRKFNNWVKSVLIGRYAQRGITVLDMGCGKGGDLLKWNKANIARLIGIGRHLSFTLQNLAQVSIEHARQRWNEMRGMKKGINPQGSIFRKFAAEFHTLDCFSVWLHQSLKYPISTKIARNEEFDVVSMQFCLHYSYESEEKARMALKNITVNLKRGGIFLGTLPDSNWIVKKLKNLPSNTLEFGNSIYSIRFEQKEEYPEFGHKYWFDLKEAISNCPEYLVRFAHFEQLASEYGLRLIYKKRFHDLYDEAKEESVFRDLLYSMRVINPNMGEMSEEEWEAAYILDLLLRKCDNFHQMVAQNFRHLAAQGRFLHTFGYTRYFLASPISRHTSKDSKLAFPGSQKGRAYSSAAATSLLLGHNYRPSIIYKKRRPALAVTKFQVRDLSFTTIPRFIFHAMRIPVAGVTAGAAGLTYANYKLGDIANKSQNWLNSVTDGIKSTFGALGDGISFDLPKLDLRLPEFFSNLFSPSNSNASVLPNKLQMDSDRPRFIKKEDENSNDSGSSEKSGNGMVVAAATGTAALFDREEGEEEEEETESSNARRLGGAHDDQFMLLTRKLIEVRNILMSIDHNEALRLPSIVVIGSQSSGKSSVLEAIVGHEFLPKGSNMVTRRPIELTLIHTPKSKEDYGEFPQLGLGKIHDFKHIQQTLRDLNLAVPESECVSNKPIELRIYSSNVPDLTLIDLPGYIQINNKNQPETLKDKIFELCEQYIKEPNIILAVCSADVDLANSEALKAGRKVDPLGLRTIGVITKMDLVEPEVGAGILRNTDYPLHLGYIGVVCKSPATTSGQKNISSALIRNEEQFFRSNYVYSQRGIEVGTATLRRKLMEVLEESMAKSLFSIVGAVQTELEEARYQFKVEYNDRRITAESYVAETIDSIKHNFKDFAHSFGKPQVRHEVRTMLEQRVLDLCAELYWTDPKITELPKVSVDDLYWQYKLDMCSAALTKSGIGRTSTQLVVDVLMANMERLAGMDPLSNHPATSREVLNFSNEILRNKFHTTADQVENCVKPYKYEVECSEQEWAEGVKRSINLVEKELDYCEKALKNIKNTIGKRKLKAAIKYILDAEKERTIKARNISHHVQESEAIDSSYSVSSSPLVSSSVSEEVDYMETNRLHFNPKLLEKARESIFLRDRSIILKYRLAALKSRQCKSPENKQYCPEAFLNMVAEKLTYTAVMFIQVELLNEFFFQFPREVDNRLVYDLDRKQVLAFAKENPHIRKHLEVQERKRKLEEVMDKLNYLVRRQRDMEGKTKQYNRKGSGY